MTYTSETGETAYRALNQFADEVESDGPWRWKCVVRNGVRLPITASLEEGFLQLTCFPGRRHRSATALDNGLRCNNMLSGGVRVALDSSSRVFHLRTEIAVVEEKQLLDRLHWTLGGFHEGYHLLKSGGSPGIIVAPTAAHGTNLSELLRETSWPCTERGPDDFSVELDACSAPPASIRMIASGVVLSVEMARVSMSADASRQAMAVFLLTASSALRLVRAFAEQADVQKTFGFKVFLPPEPLTEEIEHGLAALSIAYQMCAHEASVLLDEAAARCYLAARNTPTQAITNQRRRTHYGKA